METIPNFYSKYCLRTDNYEYGDSANFVMSDIFDKESVFVVNVHTFGPVKNIINPLNPELNPICYLLAL